MAKYLMGLDNGGTTTKAVIFDLEGNTIAISNKQTELLALGGGRTERDMEQLWEVNCEVIREAVASAGIDAEEILGLSLSGHGKGLYLWGKDNRPAYNGIVSTDTRAYRYPEKWEADGTADRIFAKTCQRILPSQPVSLVRWLMDNEPQVIEKTQWIFGVKDYIRFRLTGQAAAEMTDFSGSNLVNIKEAAYDRELLDAFGLGDIYGKLPPLKYSTEITGHITEESSGKTGLKAGTPVAAGMFDIDASAIAMDITDQDKLCVIAGTWSINEYISKEPVLNKTVMMNSLYCLPGYYLVEECSPTSAANNEWFIGRFMEKEKEQARKEGASIYEAMNRMVEGVSPEEQDILFLPYIFGSNYNPLAKACFIGMESHHSKAQIARAVYEGIVFCHKVHIEKLLKNNPNLRTVRLAGGAANSAVWVQIFADVLDLPIETIDTKELGALGAAMAAGVAAGVYEDLQDAAKKIVKIKDRVEPIQKNVETYRRKYRLYREAEEALDGLWKKFRVSE
ncbi:FGGY-family carbohydrate kinase [Anaerotalea alkaliphila]|uniref:Carbohydrate kinase n=1 Tax=Anaerotalea alkaliphila TaxID=2662126 RepID=A0A7X5KM82_9FIRM|nr:FGGY-family carbohydrate kinase [Anaerotalea alkaliphila]NDL67681.1 carbohydrate kinase [Anaerotalea alkaliphila]